jgi:hypothetical protein
MMFVWRIVHHRIASLLWTHQWATTECHVAFTGMHIWREFVLISKTSCNLCVCIFWRCAVYWQSGITSKCIPGFVCSGRDTCSRHGDCYSQQIDPGVSVFGWCICDAGYAGTYCNTPVATAWTLAVLVAVSITLWCYTECFTSAFQFCLSVASALSTCSKQLHCNQQVQSQQAGRCTVT